MVQDIRTMVSVVFRNECRSLLQNMDLEEPQKELVKCVNTNVKPFLKVYRIKDWIRQSKIRFRLSLAVLACRTTKRNFFLKDSPKTLRTMDRKKQSLTHHLISNQIFNAGRHQKKKLSGANQRDQWSAPGDRSTTINSLKSTTNSFLNSLELYSELTAHYKEIRLNPTQPWKNCSTRHPKVYLEGAVDGAELHHFPECVSTIFSPREFRTEMKGKTPMPSIRERHLYRKLEAPKKWLNEITCNVTRQVWQKLGAKESIHLILSDRFSGLMGLHGKIMGYHSNAFCGSYRAKKCRGLLNTASVTATP